MNFILSQSPWEILGLAGDADAAAIKRAYAAKLKIFRPDEDPVGFQRLREARDAAIRISEFRAREAAKRALEWEDEDEDAVAGVAVDALEAEAGGSEDDHLDEDGCSPVRLPDASPPRLQQPDFSPLPASTDAEAENKGETAVLRARLSIPTAPPAMPEAVPPPKDLSGRRESESGHEDAPETQPEAEFASRSTPAPSPSPGADGHPSPAAPEPASSRPQAPPLPPPLSQPAPPPAKPPAQVVARKPLASPPPANPDQLARAALAKRFEAGAGVWDGPAWRQIMCWIADSGFEERASLERIVVTNLGDVMRKQTWDSPAPISRLKRWLQPKRLRQAEVAAGELSRSRAQVLRLIDEEFGWSRDDRMLYANLGHELADRLADHVREARAADPAVARALVFPPRRRASGFPILEERDLVAFLGTRSGTYLNYYQAARHANAYSMDWSFSGFVFPFVMLMRARRWFAGLGVFAADMLAGSAVIWLAMDGRPALAIAVMLAQFAGHLFAGLQAKRWLIEAAARAVEQADKLALVFAAERARHLRRAGKLPAVAIIAGFVFTGMMDGELIALRDGDKPSAPSASAPPVGGRP